MPQFAQRLGFDLANAFAGHVERLADFFQSVLRAIVHAKAHADNFFLARAQRTQHVLGALLQIAVDRGVGGRNFGLVFDQVAEMRIALFANRSLQRDWHAHDFANLAHRRFGNVHLLCDFRRGGLVPERLHQLPRGTNQLVHYFDHVYWQPDGASLVRECPADRLANPPGCVRGKFIAAAVLKLVDGFHQADVAFLDQVEELQSAVAIFLGNRNHQAQVRFNQFVLGLLRPHFAQDDGALGAMQLGKAHSCFGFKPRHFNPMLSLRRAILLLELFTAGRRDLLFKAADLTVQPTHYFERLVDAFGQPLLLRIVEPESANVQRDPNHLTPQPRPAPKMFARLLFRRNRSQLLGELVSRLVVLVEFGNLPGYLLRALLQNLFRDFFVVDNDRVLDGAQPALQVRPYGQHLQNHDRRARKRLQFRELSAFDTLGNLHFLLSSEQRRSAHLAQINPYRIGGGIGGAGRQVEFDLVRLFPRFERGKRRARLFEHVESTRANARQQIVYILGAMCVLRNQFVPLVVHNIGLAFYRHQSVPNVFHSEVECFLGVVWWRETTLAGRSGRCN